MRDLHLKKRPAAGKNRLKKERQPIDYRGFLKKGARGVVWLTAIAFAGVVSFEIYTLFAKTTFLRLERIEVSRLTRLTQEDVISLAGVKIGDDMLGLRLRRIGEQLSKNPWLAKVKVRRYFPHTLSIEVTERVPVAIVSMSYLYYLDTAGEVFKPLNEGDRLDFPILTGLSEEEMGKDPKGSRDAMKRTLEIIALLKERDVFKLDDVSEIHYDKGYGFTLFTANAGIPVKLGNSNFDEKLARLARIYREVQAQLPQLEYIDLDYNDKIIVKRV
jgi:cell division septal protein FtsQ